MGPGTSAGILRRPRTTGNKTRRRRSERVNITLWHVLDGTGDADEESIGSKPTAPQLRPRLPLTWYTNGSGTPKDSTETQMSTKRSGKSFIRQAQAVILVMLSHVLPNPANLRRLTFLPASVHGGPPTGKPKRACPSHAGGFQRLWSAAHCQDWHEIPPLMSI